MPTTHPEIHKVARYQFVEPLYAHEHLVTGHSQMERGHPLGCGKPLLVPLLGSVACPEPQKLFLHNPVIVELKGEALNGRK